MPGFAFLEDVWVSIPTGGLGSGCPPCPQGLLEHQVLSGGVLRCQFLLMECR